MTRQEIAENMTATCSWWSAEQWSTFWQLSQPEQEAMAQIAQDSGVVPSDGWATALKVFETGATIFGDLVGVGTGIEAIKATIKSA
jgi:hypothetical protein